MTLKQAKEAVKAKYPGAVCCSEWADSDGNGSHWHRQIRSRRNGVTLSSPVSVKIKGADGLAWKEAAVEVSA